jgi:hypothetical protein
MRRLTRAIATLAAALAATFPLGATLTVVSQPQPPSGPAVALASPAPADPESLDAYLWTHGSGTAVGVGQTFRLDRPLVLDRITVLVRPLTEQVAGEPVVLTVHRFSGPADATPDAPVAAAAGLLPVPLPVGVPVYLVLDLDDVALEADLQYGFLLEFGGGGGVNDSRADVFHTGADTYAGGRPFLHEGASFDGEDPDLVFFLEGVEETACEPPPAEEALSTPELPGFRFWVRFGDPATEAWWGEGEPLCTPETLCVSGALAGRTEVLVRIVGPKPNGYLWPTLVKLSTSRVELWIEQESTGLLKCYLLEGRSRGARSSRASSTAPGSCLELPDLRSTLSRAAVLLGSRTGFRDGRAAQRAARPSFLFAPAPGSARRGAGLPLHPCRDRQKRPSRLAG